MEVVSTVLTTHGSISEDRRLLRSEKQQNHKIFTVKTGGANRPNLGFNLRSRDPKYNQISLLVVYATKHIAPVILLSN